MQKIINLIKLMRLDKPIGILLLLYPCILALIAGSGFAPEKIELKFWLIFIIGSILMRSAGCVINDYFDQDIDKHVKRTENRPLAAAQISSKNALYLLLFLCILAACLLFFLPLQTYIFVVFAFILAMTYPLAKRYLAIPQAYLGLCFSMSMPVAYYSFSNVEKNFNGFNIFNEFNIFNIFTLIFLMLANFLWVLSYDTFYAMVDKADDFELAKQQKIKTSALFFGKYDYVYALIFYYLSFTGFLLILIINNLFYNNLIAILSFATAFVWMCWHSYQIFKIFIQQKANILLNNTNILSNQARRLCFSIFKQQAYIGGLYCLAYLFS